MKIGVLALQGDVGEHVAAVESAITSSSAQGSVVPIRRASELDGLSGLLMPGGESTTISKQLDRFGLRRPISEMAGTGIPIMGTCAGCVLLSGKVLDRGAVSPLGLIDIAVRRNAFGRQADSFERPLKIPGLEGEFPGIFIRAPRIESVGTGVESLATLEGEHVMVRKDNILALTFHPELANDPRLHALFLGMVRP